MMQGVEEVSGFDARQAAQANVQTDSYPARDKGMNINQTIMPNPYPTVQPPYVFPSQGNVYYTYPTGTVALTKPEYEKLVESKHKLEAVERLQQTSLDDHTMLQAIWAAIAPNV
jgi:hypothetical protein